MRWTAAAIAALALAAPAAAAPRFAVWDLQSNLSAGSHNSYGDVQVMPRAKLRGGSPVRCGAWCRLGDGWLAFRGTPRLAPADIVSARMTKTGGWSVELRLKTGAWRRWQAFAKQLAADAKRRGVPDVLVVAASGEVAATPISSDVHAAGRTVTVRGFTRASASAVVRALRR